MKVILFIVWFVIMFFFVGFLSACAAVGLNYFIPPQELQQIYKYAIPIAALVFTIWGAKAERLPGFRPKGQNEKPTVASASTVIIAVIFALAILLGLWFYIQKTF